jgi:hypothetical protein
VQSRLLIQRLRGVGRTVPPVLASVPAVFVMRPRLNAAGLSLRGGEKFRPLDQTSLRSFSFMGADMSNEAANLPEANPRFPRPILEALQRHGYIDSLAAPDWKVESVICGLYGRRRTELQAGQFEYTAAQVNALLEGRAAERSNAARRFDEWRRERSRRF